MPVAIQIVMAAMCGVFCWEFFVKGLAQSIRDIRREWWL